MANNKLFEQVCDFVRIIALVSCNLFIFYIVSMVSSFHDPGVSVTIGAKMHVAGYFVHLSSTLQFSAA